MFFKTKEIFAMDNDKLSNMMDSYLRVPESKVFSKSEDLAIKASVLSFGKTVTQCGKGRIVPVEFKSIVKEFEDVNYDITKLPYITSKSFKKTYDDLKTTCETHKEFKNTQAKLYCNIYDFFSNATNIKFISRLKKDPIVKNITSSESLDLESIEEWLSEADDSNITSEEAFGTISGFLTSIKSSFLTLSTNLNTTMLSVQSLTTMISILLIIIGILLLILVIINLNYKSELSNILSILAERSKNGENIEKDEEEVVYKATKNMCENTNVMVKNFIFKPTSACLSGIQNITSKAYNWFDKTLSNIKNKKIKTSSENLNPEQSEEFNIAGLLGSISVPIFVVVSLVLIMTLIKPAVYFFYHLRLKGYQFLTDEAELIQMNIIELIKEKERATSDKEKERIQKIIDKQRSICDRMGAFANILYNSEVTAAMDTRDDTRKDDNIDYTEVAEQMDNPTRNNPTSDNTSYDQNTDATNSTSNNNDTSVILF